MKFYDEGGGSLEVGRSFDKDGKILFEIDQDYSGGSIKLNEEDVGKLVDFLGLALSKMRTKED